VLRPDLPVGVASAVTVAGYAHDTGKWHDIWQSALCNLAPADEREAREAGRPWAKSAVKGGSLRFPKGVKFRHELVSMLLLDGPLRALLDAVEDPNLVRYLVLAHHGKLRLQVGEPTDKEPTGQGSMDRDEKTLLGLTHGDSLAVPRLLGQPTGELTIDLDQFTFGGDRSWTRTALELRDRYGPFVLAYLETVVRIADWRASRGSEEAT
jgi:CRISPR-associated endonuclease/helicase Cas3